MPSLLLINVESAMTDYCYTFLLTLQENGRLDCIVLDEAHLILTAGHYRERLDRLGYLQTLHCPFVCLIVTLPPCAEPDLRKILYLSQLRIICGRRGRHNLRYTIQLVQPLRRSKSREKAFLLPGGCHM